MFDIFFKFLEYFYFHFQLLRKLKKYTCKIVILGYLLSLKFYEKLFALLRLKQNGKKSKVWKMCPEIGINITKILKLRSGAGMISHLKKELIHR